MFRGTNHLLQTELRRRTGQQWPLIAPFISRRVILVRPAPAFRAKYLSKVLEQLSFSACFAAAQRAAFPGLFVLQEPAKSTPT
jgi:hypothetical protein